ncbi:MAG TPA: YezD family protein [Candidatus Pseudogracilibacillus intestinigallinarum]|uniref:YezD family protein n=1 Tax=Candidatus Pseudogracilibacillus intestinigallinarum TaxID=2838742 RepID=A0A9D1TJH3_9BACI|nr:YezD family protein [Candidatus Pseudogracilibacillus intestinigallinarum]
MIVKNDIESEAQLSKKIFDMLKTISFGTITIIVQDGKIIQLEKNEKIRLK